MRDFPEDGFLESYAGRSQPPAKRGELQRGVFYAGVALVTRLERSFSDAKPVEEIALRATELQHFRDGHAAKSLPESQQSLLRRFRKKVASSKVLSTFRRNRWFVSESEQRRISKQKAIRKQQRKSTRKRGNSKR